MPLPFGEGAAKFYKKKMKAIKKAMEEGNEAEANRHADELMEHFNIK
jgi:hypothetical protein